MPLGYRSNWIGMIFAPNGLPHINENHPYCKNIHRLFLRS